MLKFLRFREAGNLKLERVVFSAQETANVGNIILCRTRSSDGYVFPEIYDSLWLPDIEVSKGDYVSVYTKSGVTGSKVGPDGKTTHFFYWDRELAIWDADEVAAVLMNVASWSFLVPDK